jgi:hypothetical protein
MTKAICILDRSSRRHPESRRHYADAEPMKNS